MSIHDYEHLKNKYHSADGELDFTTAQTTVTLEAALNSTTDKITIQRVIVWIKTDALQSITFQDTNGTPRILCKVPSSPGADTRWDFDFGPAGKQLTAGKDFTATFSAAGLAGHMVWYGYHQFTVT
jgi:hypothetical protein